MQGGAAGVLRRGGALLCRRPFQQAFQLGGSLVHGAGGGPGVGKEGAALRFQLRQLPFQAHQLRFALRQLVPELRFPLGLAALLLLQAADATQVVLLLRLQSRFFGFQGGNALLPLGNALPQLSQY